MGGSAAFGGSKQKSASESFISPEQLPFLQSLWQAAQGQQGQAQGGFNQLPGLGQDLAQQSQGFVNQLQGAGSGLDQFIDQGSTDQQIQGVTGVVQNFLNQQLTGAGGIAGQSNQAGQFGGGRSDVLSGTAIGQAGVGLGALTSQILGQDTQRRQNAALGQGALQNQGALGGLGGLESIFGLQSGGLLGQFGGLNSLAGLLGDPTVLGLGGSRGKSFDTSGSFSFFGG